MKETVTLGEIPGGFAGSVATLRKMRDIVRGSLVQPEVVGCANRIIMLTPARNQVAQAHAIRGWLDGHFRFVRDPMGVELLRTPMQQLKQIETNGAAMGDCDDAAILGASMALANGIPAVFRIIGFRHTPPGTFSHVFAVITPNILTPGSPRAIDLDVTKPAQGAAEPVRWKDFPV